MTRRAKRGRPSPNRGRKLPRRDREVVEYHVRELRLKRMRTTVGFLGLIPFAGSLACDAGVGLFCVPWSWYMAVWAAVFGAFVGLSIRLVRERRRFEAQQPRAS
jgi:hypothetical protein